MIHSTFYKLIINYLPILHHLVISQDKVTKQANLPNTISCEKAVNSTYNLRERKPVKYKT
jgi:hypothetical protein